MSSVPVSIASGLPDPPALPPWHEALANKVVAGVAALSLNPGDVLVVRHPRGLAAPALDDLTRAAARVGRMLGRKVVVAPEDVRLGCLPPAALREAGWVRAEEAAGEPVAGEAWPEPHGPWGPGSRLRPEHAMCRCLPNPAVLSAGVTAGPPVELHGELHGLKEQAPGEVQHFVAWPEVLALCEAVCQPGLDPRVPVAGFLHGRQELGDELLQRVLADLDRGLAEGWAVPAVEVLALCEAVLRPGADPRLAVAGWLGRHGELDARLRDELAEYGRWRRADGLEQAPPTCSCCGGRIEPLSAYLAADQAGPPRVFCGRDCAEAARAEAAEDLEPPPPLPAAPPAVSDFTGGRTGTAEVCAQCGAAIAPDALAWCVRGQAGAFCSPACRDSAPAPATGASRAAGPVQAPAPDPDADATPPGPGRDGPVRWREFL